MSGLLNIDKGSPSWWLSNDIWVTPAGDPTSPPGLTDPTQGKPYSVSVLVHNKYSDPVSSGWDLFLCWQFPPPAQSRDQTPSAGKYSIMLQSVSPSPL